MVHVWRYLRRPLPDGPEDVLDLGETVERAARQGFFLGPVYRRRERNHAHLILLVDQDGSMTPFHRFTRDLFETAREESDIETVEIFYFHNVVTTSVHADRHLTKALPFSQLVERLDPETALLVVSDAGSARGHRHLPRVQATAEWVVRLKRCGTQLAWLNPAPVERWTGTSAQMIARMVPMFAMEPDGFSNAVDVLRGHGQMAARG